MAKSKSKSLDMESRQAVKELKKLVEEAISSNQLMKGKDDDVVRVRSREEARIPLLTAQDHCHYNHKDMDNSSLSLWGVPLLKDERTDVILLKLLQEKSYKVMASFESIKSTLRWRREFGVDDDDDYYSLEVFRMDDVGRDREGRPVCYNVLHDNFPYMEMEWNAKEEERGRFRTGFIRSWILSLERMIRKRVDFRPGGVNAIFCVNDLANCAKPWLRELNHIIPLLQDHYPQSIANQVFINAPRVYSWLHIIMRSKFVFIRPRHTLFKYVSPEQVPISCGGLHADDDLSESSHRSKFTIDGPAPRFRTISPKAATVLGFTVWRYKTCTTPSCILDWEIRVVDWEVRYMIVFVPKSDDKTYIIVQHERHVTKTDHPVLSGTFHITVPGTLCFHFRNLTWHTRKIIYRATSYCPPT